MPPATRKALNEPFRMPVYAIVEHAASAARHLPYQEQVP